MSLYSVSSSLFLGFEIWSDSEHKKRFALPVGLNRDLEKVVERIEQIKSRLAGPSAGMISLPPHPYIMSQKSALLEPK